eukprot:scaffold2675_cov398-Prasinococcus_capsulatus_cf.AAC.6
MLGMVSNKIPRGNGSTGRRSTHWSGGPVRPMGNGRRGGGRTSGPDGVAPLPHSSTPLPGPGHARCVEATADCPRR